MFDRRLGTLTLTLLGSILATAPARAGAVVDYVGTYIWSMDQSTFGGFSAIDISPDGTGFHALTDRAHLYWGRVERDAQGLVRGMAVAGRANLKDSKGIAVGRDGRIHVSFEGLDRVATYDDPDAPATTHPRPPELPGIGVNVGLEALAIDDDGTLFAVPERSASEAQPFTILSYDGAWTEYGQIRRDPRWRAVGADFGPDGWFYLLERDFRGIFGFASRVRRMQLAPGVIQDDQILLETRPLQYDNLEGISVWDDGVGMRITLISDDNFLFVQRTEIVEYRLRDTDLQALRN